MMHTSRLKSSTQALSRVVFPELCLGCSRPLATAVVCDTCRRQLARPEAREIAERLAKTDAEPLAWSVALWRFDAGGTVQRVQHALKYRGRPSLGVALGQDLGRLCSSWHPSAVVPVPLSRPRLLERGYNQAEPLARGLADHLSAPLAPTLLERTRATASQATLAFKDRRANVDGAFSLTSGVAPEALSGQRVLLVDDVLTTGATLLAAAAPLRRAGACVGIAVLALAG